MPDTNSDLYKQFYDAEAKAKNLELVLRWLEAHDCNNKMLNGLRRDSIPQIYLDTLLPIVRKELESF